MVSAGRCASLRRCFRVALAALITAVVSPSLASADDLTLSNAGTDNSYCAAANAFAYSDGPSGDVSPCALRTGSFVFETIYLQNASRVGGTALAAYPLVDVRFGVLRRLQVTLDAPSAIAQSRPGGGGAFPVTHAGYGLTYTIAQSSRFATALVSDVLPPDSPFAPTHLQSRYLLGLSTGMVLASKWTLGAAASSTSSAHSGFAMVLPTIDATAAYAPSTRTQIATDLGERIVTRRAVAQTFGDVAVKRMLDAKLLFTVGVGTTFNAVSNTKPHYLASGFTYRP